MLRDVADSTHCQGQHHPRILCCLGRATPVPAARRKTQARQMLKDDPELRRLKEIERLARDRFLRLSLPGTFGGHAEVIKAAEALWH
jgi:hypothetical protein